MRKESNNFYEFQLKISVLIFILYQILGCRLHHAVTTATTTTVHQYLKPLKQIQWKIIINSFKKVNNFEVVTELLAILCFCLNKKGFSCRNFVANFTYDKHIHSNHYSPNSLTLRRR